MLKYDRICRRCGSNRNAFPAPDGTNRSTAPGNNNMDKLIQNFKAVRTEFIETLEIFPIDKVDEKLFGEWNLKDVVAHFIGWDKEFTKILQDFLRGEKHEYWGKICEFNERVVFAAKNKSWQEILNEFKSSGSEFIESYSGYSKELLSTKIWRDKTYTPTKILEINTHHYQKAQLIEIKKLLKKYCK